MTPNSQSIASADCRLWALWLCFTKKTISFLIETFVNKLCFLDKACATKDLDMQNKLKLNNSEI